MYQCLRHMKGESYERHTNADLKIYQCLRHMKGESYERHTNADLKMYQYLRLDMKIIR